jgi:putative addiction module component (TIGR02574 family)
MECMDLDEEARFIQAVTRGEEALRRGEYLTHEQVGQRLEEFFAALRISPAQQAEMDRRLATLDQDRAQSVTWQDLKAELEQRCP